MAHCQPMINFATQNETNNFSLHLNDNEETI